MFPRTNIILIILIMAGIPINLIGIGVLADNGDYDSEAARQSRSVRTYHDTLTQAEDEGPQPPPKLHKRRSLKLIPADDALRHDYYPENVEEALGKVRINRRLRRDPNEEAPAAQGSDLSSGNLDELREHDLEEIFQILARRDGQLLEQMLSLKSAIERLYGIFEFMGIANLPPSQRDAAVRKVLERSFNVEFSRRARMRMKRA